jgi:hypothetical protein
MTALPNISRELSRVLQVIQVRRVPQTPYLRLGVLRSTQLPLKISEVPADV